MEHWDIYLFLILLYLVLGGICILIRVHYSDLRFNRERKLFAGGFLRLADFQKLNAERSRYAKIVNFLDITNMFSVSYYVLFRKIISDEERQWEEALKHYETESEKSPWEKARGLPPHRYDVDAIIDNHDQYHLAVAELLAATMSDAVPHLEQFHRSDEDFLYLYVFFRSFAEDRIHGQKLNELRDEFFFQCDLYDVNVPDYSDEILYRAPSAQRRIDEPLKTVKDFTRFRDDHLVRLLCLSVRDQLSATVHFQTQLEKFAFRFFDDMDALDRHYNYIRRY